MQSLISDNIVRKRFSVEELQITAEEVESLARMDENLPSYAGFIEDELLGRLKNASIQGGYLIEPAEVVDETIIIEGNNFEVGPTIAGALSNSEQVAFFVCTAGNEISERVNELNAKGDWLEAYLVDVMGSVMVETAMDKLQAIIENECVANGLRITNRYSPGYSGWNVKEQALLFSFFPEKFCGITLSDSCLMHPVKSVSGFIGIGTKVRYRKHACSQCNATNCIYRNSKKHCDFSHLNG
ncbi:hypothetical protein KDU71_00500 [Carboxylicivirga sediminis]|uniref:AdoMet activation domain-containing protein n=1 Tax=Carboxylicivirga sediminis TaxID=2006564 RepID=A0A941EZE0_9BACT|nr:vitamin B12 dependent-methionine synthase activation domain-containing protein [Carboxylicivirga sediminis]MBR8534024.1 hypothetical protein [Carboxylicivirga sediminis]